MLFKQYILNVRVIDTVSSQTGIYCSSLCILYFEIKEFKHTCVQVSVPHSRACFLHNSRKEAHFCHLLRELHSRLLDQMANQRQHHRSDVVNQYKHRKQTVPTRDDLTQAIPFNTQWKGASLNTHIPYAPWNTCRIWSVNLSVYVLLPSPAWHLLKASWNNSSLWWIRKDTCHIWSPRYLVFGRSRVWSPIPGNGTAKLPVVEIGKKGQ